VYAAGVKLEKTVAEWKRGCFSNRRHVHDNPNKKINFKNSGMLPKFQLCNSGKRIEWEVFKANWLEGRKLWEEFLIFRSCL